MYGILNSDTRASRNQYDKAPLDLNKLGVYYSPQQMINEDIIAQLGYQQLDEYIGDPRQQYEKAYPDLIQKSQEYWKKYTEKNDINAYLKIFSLFDLSFFRQLEQLLPARTDKILGLLLQPNILERSKDTVLPTIERFNNTYLSDLNAFNNILTGSYDVYETQIESPDIYSISGYKDEEKLALISGTLNPYDKFYILLYKYNFLEVPILLHLVLIGCVTPYRR